MIRIAIGLFGFLFAFSAHAQRIGKISSDFTSQAAPPVVADWTFEEGTSGTDILIVRDQSGNGHDLLPLVPPEGIPQGPSARFLATDSVTNGLVSAGFSR